MKSNYQYSEFGSHSAGVPSSRGNSAPHRPSGRKRPKTRKKFLNVDSGPIFNLLPNCFILWKVSGNFLFNKILIFRLKLPEFWNLDILKKFQRGICPFSGFMVFLLTSFSEIWQRCRTHSHPLPYAHHVLWKWISTILLKFIFTFLRNLTINKAMSQAAKIKQQLTLRWDFLGGNFLDRIF